MRSVNGRGWIHPEEGEHTREGSSSQKGSYVLLKANSFCTSLMVLLGLSVSSTASCLPDRETTVTFISELPRERNSFT